MKTMFLFIIGMVTLSACGSSTGSKAEIKDEEVEDSAYVMKETIVPPADTAMILKQGGKRLNFRDAICAKWIFKPIETVQAEDPEWDENNSRQFPELIFFSDSQVVENPRNKMRIGKWEAVAGPGQIILHLRFRNGDKKYAVQSITNYDLWLSEASSKGDSITKIGRASCRERV